MEADQKPAVAGRGGWDEYRLLVMDRLERLDEKQDAQTTKLDGLSAQMEKLSHDITAYKRAAKIAAGILGMIGGALTWLLDHFLRIRAAGAH